MSIELVTKLLLGLLHLSVACDNRHSRLRLLPLATMLEIAFEGSIPRELLAPVSRALTAPEQGQNLGAELNALGNAIDDAAAHDSTIFERFERTVDAIDTL